MESALAATLATAALVADLWVQPRVDGLIFGAGSAAYVVGRQLLFPLRGSRRKTRRGRRISLVVAGAAFLVPIVTGALG